MLDIDAVHHRYQRAMETKDPDAIAAALAADVVLHSPTSPKPFEGRETVARVLTAITEVLQDLTFGELVTNDEDGRVGIIFRAHIGDRRLQGIDFLRFDDDGLIAEFTVMVRPLSGLVALQNEMAPRFGAAQVMLQPRV